MTIDNESTHHLCTSIILIVPDLDIIIYVALSWKGTVRNTITFEIILCTHGFVCTNEQGFVNHMKWH